VERDAGKTEAAQMKGEKEKEAHIDDEMLEGVTSEEEDDSDNSINS
jgi:hypothetical protein